MARNSVNSGGGEGKYEWPTARLDRIETTRLVWEHILDPILTFSELIQGYDHENGIDHFTPKEISAVWRLLGRGGFTETKMYSTSIGGSMRHFSCDTLEKELKDWDEGVEGGAE